MMQAAGWILAIALSAALGYSAGTINGKSVERGVIANDCRQSGGFTHNRTGFACEVVKNATRR